MKRLETKTSDYSLINLWFCLCCRSSLERLGAME